MKDFLLYVWQLPQHMLGLLLILLLKAEKRVWPHKGVNMDYWRFRPESRFGRFISGGSFGKYILLPPRRDLELTVPHEYGHGIQSRAWGPLYLLAVGLPSAVFNNLWDRVFHKRWTAERRRKWYYGRWPEKQADRLGGVTRDREGCGETLK